MRRIKYILLLIVAIIILYPHKSAAYASDVESEISENVDDQLDSMDFSVLDNMLINLTGEQSNLFSAPTFVDHVKDVISGKLSASFSTFWGYIASIIFDDILKFLPIMSAIIAISVLCSFLGNSSISGKTKSISSIVFFACFGVIVSLVSVELINIMKSCMSTIGVIKSQIDVLFPILITLMTAVGGAVTATTFQPLMGLLAGGIINIFTTIVVPIFVFSFVFVIVGNLTSNIKLEMFNKFTMSLFKWIVGGVFTIFLGFVAIKGIVASSVDKISIKTAKFALKSYIPILGGYLSDGLNLIVASSILIKNAIGATGLVLLLITVLAPVVKIMVFSLFLKLVSAIVEPISDAKISNFIYSISSTLTILLVSILAVSFMYVVVVGMLMCCGNIV